MFSAMIVVTAYFLSEIEMLATTWGWCVVGAVPIILLVIQPRFLGTFQDCQRTTLSERWDISTFRFTGVHPLLKPGLGVAIASAIVIAAANLILAVATAPYNWDSMTYHLTRMAYYIQFQSLDWYPANFWAQVEQPKIATILNIFVFLLFQRSEATTQLVQFGAYLTTGICIYAICRHLRTSGAAAIIGALLFLLSINVVMESETTQNDLVVLVFMASAIYFGLRYLDDGRAVWLIAFGLAAGLSLGTKATGFLLLPAGMVILLGGLHAGVKQGQSMRILWKRMAALAAAFLAGLVLLAMPAGYIANKMRYGHVLGDPNVVAMHVGDATGGTISDGLANTGRFVVDLTRMDGLPLKSVNRQIPEIAFGIMHSMLATVHIDMLAAPSRAPYALFEERFSPIAHEDLSYIGPLALFLILPMLFAGAVLNRDSWFVGFAGAVLIFFLTQAFVGPYDPWRGRYFTALPFLAAPAVALTIDRVATRAVAAALISLVLIVGGVSAVHAVLTRSGVHFPGFLFETRTEQLVTRNQTVGPSLDLFERLVSSDAVVTVVLGGDSYEYPFFGRGLTRYLIPGGTWPGQFEKTEGRTSQYLLYNHGVVRRSCDVALGAGYWLRDERTCAAEH